MFIVSIILQVFALICFVGFFVEARRHPYHTTRLEGGLITAAVSLNVSGWIFWLLGWVQELA